MDFDVVLVADALFNQKLENVASVVSLKLNNCSPLLVFHSGAVAAPRLFKVAQNFLEVQVVRQTLDQSQAFTRRPLLELKMHHSVGFFSLLVLVGVLLLIVVELTHFVTTAYQKHLIAVFGIVALLTLGHLLLLLRLSLRHY